MSQGQKRLALPSAGIGRVTRGWSATLAAHRELVFVLVAGALLRVGVMVAYRPALFFSDSWGYLKMALAHQLVGIAPLRPSGYPLLLRVFSLNGHSLLLLVGVQHLAGLATGTLVYAALVNAGTGRRLAAGGAAIVLLDMWAISLEQHVLTEALFTLALMASLYLATRSSTYCGFTASGVLLALAVTMRPVALFAAPIWVLCLALRRTDVWRWSSGVCAFVVPLIVYCSLHAAATGTFGFTQANGWFLYARIGQIVDCRGVPVTRSTARLCQKGTRPQVPTYYLFDPRSPARRVFGGMSSDHVRQARSDAALQAFALHVIEAHPTAYLRVVASDLLRFLTPGASAGAIEDSTVKLPKKVSLSVGDRHERAGLPPYSPSAHPPARILSWLGGWLHTSRWLISLLALASLLALILPGRHRVQVVLFAGGGAALLLGAAATAGFAIRYLEPAVPLLVTGGLLSLNVLLTAVRDSRTTRHRASMPGQRDSVPGLES